MTPEEAYAIALKAKKENIQREHDVEQMLEKIRVEASKGEMYLEDYFDQNLKDRLIFLGYNVSLPYLTGRSWYGQDELMRVSWERRNPASDIYENDYKLLDKAKNEFIAEVTGWRIVIESDGTSNFYNGDEYIMSTISANLNDKDVVNLLFKFMANNERLLREIKLKAIADE